MKDALAAVHFTPIAGEVAANREALVALSADAAGRAALVVLPELATTGFALDRARAEALAEPLDGPTVGALAEVSRAAGAVVVVGLCLRDPDGALRNAAVVLDRGRTLARYAKHRLYGHDLAWARAGAAPGGVVATSAGRVGLLICHDLAWPDVVDAVARDSPDVVAFPTNWIEGAHGLPESWIYAAWALSGVPLIVANRGGAEDACCRFREPSGILRWAPRGQLTATLSADGSGPEVVVAARSSARPPAAPG